MLTTTSRKIRVWPDLETQIRPEPEPEPNLGRTSFRITEQYIMLDKTDGVSNTASCYKRQYSSVLPLLRHCLPVFDEIFGMAMDFCIFFCGW